MSVPVTLRARRMMRFERLAADGPAICSGILRSTTDRGLISHRVGRKKPKCSVPTRGRADTRNGFFRPTPEIEQLMQQAGVTAPAHVSFCRPADTGDAYPPAVALPEV